MENRMRKDLRGFQDASIQRTVPKRTGEWEKTRSAAKRRRGFWTVFWYRVSLVPVGVCIRLSGDGGFLDASIQGTREDS